MQVDALFAGGGPAPGAACGATAYRILQEGLTNASRHGDGRRQQQGQAQGTSESSHRFLPWCGFLGGC